MKIEKEELKLAYAKLPDNLKEVFDAEETAITLMNIGKKYGLHIDQISHLATLVHYVLLGLLATKDFIRELEKTIGISTDIANLIIYDLNQQILIKIRQELEELSQAQGLPASPKTEEPPSAPEIFDEKMRGLANVPKQEVAIAPQRDPYREGI